MRRRLAFFWIFVFQASISLASDLRLTYLVVEDARTIRATLSWKNSWSLSTDPANNDGVYITLRRRRIDLAKSPWEVVKPVIAETIKKGETESFVSSCKSIGILVEATSITKNVDSLDLRIKVESPFEQGDWVLSATAVEMASVKPSPLGFYLGDGASQFAFGGRDNQPIKSNFGKVDTLSISGLDKIAIKWPSERSFFLMKYELSQRQFIWCFNQFPKELQLTLIPELQGKAAGDMAFPAFTNNRNGLFVESVSAETGITLETQFPFVSMSGLTPRLLSACLAWLGLRPMTELEYEWACRGPLKPIAKEAAWGTNRVMDGNDLTDSLLDAEKFVERPSDSLVGLANFAKPAGEAYLQGPSRSGACQSIKNERVANGMGYYGHADLSGNLWELCLKASSKSAFEGSYLANQTSIEPWGANDEFIVRGGAWLSLVFDDIRYPFRDIAVSDRFYWNYDLTIPRPTIGGRGVINE